VREFLELTFDRLQLNWQKYVELDERYLRPTEVDMLIGDASKARKILGWEPKVRFHQLTEMMVEADLELAEHEKRAQGL
jgi:GDPmannose 4,6-dehydratase